MDALVSTGMQMMQMDVTIDQESLCIIRALNTISFDDLHKIICHKLSIMNTVPYTFYLPKTQTYIRRITRSFEERSSVRVTSFVQAGDTIFYQIYQSEFHIRFSSIGLVDEASAMEAKLLTTQGKIQHMIRKEPVTYRNRVSQRSMQMLYEISEDLYDGELFAYLSDQQFLMLHIEDMLQPVFVENQDDQFMLYFFPDEESYRRFYCVYKDTLPQQSLHKYKHGTTFRIAQKPLPFIHYHVYKDSYISFLDMKRGWELDGIDESDVEELYLIFMLLRRALPHLQQGVSLQQQEILHIYDADHNACHIEVEPACTMVLPLLLYEQQSNIDALLDQVMLSTYLEMDYRFVRQPAMSNDRIRYAYLLNVSALGPHIQSHYEHIFEKEQDIKNAILDMLINIIEEHGRIKTILVKDRYVFSILDDFCQKLGIFVQIEPHLLYTEAYFADNERVIYDMDVLEQEEPIKKAVDEQPLQHQYSRKRFKMKGYFN